MAQTDEALVEALANRVEAAAPSRWIAFLAALGAFFVFLSLAVALHANGFERLEELTTRAGFIGAALTWWEIRRPKDVAAAIRNPPLPAPPALDTREAG